MVGTFLSDQTPFPCFAVHKSNSALRNTHTQIMLYGQRKLYFCIEG